MLQPRQCGRKLFEWKRLDCNVGRTGKVKILQSIFKGVYYPEE